MKVRQKEPQSSSGAALGCRHQCTPFFSKFSVRFCSGVCIPAFIEVMIKFLQKIFSRCEASSQFLSNQFCETMEEEDDHHLSTRTPNSLKLTVCTVRHCHHHHHHSSRSWCCVLKHHATLEPKPLWIRISMSFCKEAISKGFWPLCDPRGVGPSSTALGWAM